MRPGETTEWDSQELHVSEWSHPEHKEVMFIVFKDLKWLKIQTKNKTLLEWPEELKNKNTKNEKHIETEIKNITDGLTSRLYPTEKTIGELEVRSEKSSGMHLRNKEMMLRAIMDKG